MAESLESKINHFVEFNERMMDVACSEGNLQHQAIHAKVLLCSIIDALSKSRFPNTRRNRDRFICVVDNCSNWTEQDHVSLLHLVRALKVEEHNDEEFSTVREWALERLEDSLSGSKRLLSVHVSISRDPELETVLQFWPTDDSGSPSNLGHIGLDQLQHKHLLWLYRNALVHEYNSPGKGIESSTRRDSSPYYQKLSNIKEISLETGLRFSNQWELVYPILFFQSLAEEILENVANCHLNDGTDPFASYSQGTFWIPRYNEEC